MRYVAPRIMWRPADNPPLNHWSDRAERHITSRLERAQKRHQGLIISPATRWLIGLDNFTLG